MYHHILVPVDGSATSERGLHEAIRLAADHQARLHLLHVVDDFPMLMQISTIESFQETMALVRQRGEALLDRSRQDAAAAGVSAVSSLGAVTHGRIGDAIVEEAVQNGCDLIVMGTHGRRGLNHLALGSDAERVLRTSPVPVLLIRHPAPAA